MTIAAVRPAMRHEVARIALAAGILGQVAYPLIDGPARAGLTIGTVCCLFLAVLGWAIRSYGARRGLAVTVVIGAAALLVEAIGVRTGVPFGRYRYTGVLGARWGGVPLVVPLQWIVMTWPALQAGRAVRAGRAVWAGRGVIGRGSGERLRVALLGGGTLAAWDLLLDPLLVDAGGWRWSHPHPALPGMAGVPVSNVLGWCAVGVVLIAVVDRLVPDQPASQAIPATLLGWTLCSQVLGNVAFFDRPMLALLGAAAFGGCLVPYARAITR